MTTTMPQGEAIRNAVKWISRQRKENPDAAVQTWVNQAGTRFNLSPKEQEFLIEFFKEPR